ncbi:hypothetical protein [Streptomyces sp. NPDC005989]|uniref:hypothetical protein n=1 Tax=Streptomyces sp. NPDC005989 TaxID=3156727 RepID=UPI0033E52973
MGGRDIRPYDTGSGQPGVRQTLGILMMFRRLVRDYESRPKSSESRVRWAMIDVIARRLTGQTALTWRG